MHKVHQGAMCMDGSYSVRLGKKTVGKVQVSKQGLYYRFVCRCMHAGDDVHRLVVLCADQRVSIGVLVPEGDGFGLDRKIPAKQFLHAFTEFFIAPMHETVQGKFVPISPEEPFHYIAQLKDSFLIERQGRIGVMIPDKNSRV